MLKVLERGPPGYQQTLLSIICALMRLVDFTSSATMRQFHNGALKIISKYIKVSMIFIQNLKFRIFFFFARIFSYLTSFFPPYVAKTLIDNLS